MITLAVFFIVVLIGSLVLNAIWYEVNYGNGEGFWHDLTIYLGLVDKPKDNDDA